MAPARELLCGEEDRGRGRQMTLTTKERKKLTKFVIGTKEWMQSMRVKELRGQQAQWVFVWALALFFDFIAKWRFLRYSEGVGWEQGLVMGIAIAKFWHCQWKVWRIQSRRDEHAIPHNEVS